MQGDFWRRVRAWWGLESLARMAGAFAGLMAIVAGVAALPLLEAKPHAGVALAPDRAIVNEGKLRSYYGVIGETPPAVAQEAVRVQDSLSSGRGYHFDKAGAEFPVGGVVKRYRIPPARQELVAQTLMSARTVAGGNPYYVFPLAASEISDDQLEFALQAFEFAIEDRFSVTIFNEGAGELRDARLLVPANWRAQGAPRELDLAPKGRITFEAFLPGDEAASVQDIRVEPTATDKGVNDAVLIVGGIIVAGLVLVTAYVDVRRSGEETGK